MKNRDINIDRYKNVQDKKSVVKTKKNKTDISDESGISDGKADDECETATETDADNIRSDERSGGKAAKK